jgi:hypothetical protein
MGLRLGLSEQFQLRRNLRQFSQPLAALALWGEAEVLQPVRQELDPQ